VSPGNTNSHPTGLFKELCKEKDREKSIKKNESRDASKENLNNNEGKLKGVEKEKVLGNFQSFVSKNNIRKYGEDKQFSGFSGLKKTSKLTQK
jgi:hypothetical protein